MYTKSVRMIMYGVDWGGGRGKTLYRATDLSINVAPRCVNLINVLP